MGHGARLGVGAAQPGHPDEHPDAWLGFPRGASSRESHVPETEGRVSTSTLPVYWNTTKFTGSRYMNLRAEPVSPSSPPQLARGTENSQTVNLNHRTKTSNGEGHKWPVFMGFKLNVFELDFFSLAHV